MHHQMEISGVAVAHGEIRQKLKNLNVSCDRGAHAESAVLGARKFLVFSDDFLDIFRQSHVKWL